MLGVDDVSVCEEGPWFGLGSAVDGFVCVDSAEVGVASSHRRPMVSAVEIERTVDTITGPSRRSFQG